MITYSRFQPKRSWANAMHRTDRIACTLEHNGILLKIICMGSMGLVNRNSLIIATTLHRFAQYSAQTEKKCS